ncbi:hydrogenase maturation protease [soil metagenome]
MATPRTLVIGIGHPDRGDDAAGRLVAAQLATVAPADVRIVQTDGEAGKLIDLLAQADQVVIVDAGLSGARPGTIHRLDAVAGAMPRPMFAMSSHAIGLVESIELARTLGTLPARCLVLAIEAQGFDLGAGVSPAVTEAIDRAVEMVLGELRAEAA